VGFTSATGQLSRYVQAGPFNDGRWHLVNISFADAVLVIDRQLILSMPMAPSSFSADGGEYTLPPSLASAHKACHNHECVYTCTRRMLPQHSFTNVHGGRSSS
jgi:hypothetical protein